MSETMNVEKDVERDEKTVEVKVTLSKESRSPARPRSYSHLQRNPDSLDEVEVNGVTYKIPATMGSNYWAILRVMYSHIDKPVYCSQLVKEVDELMSEHNQKNWDRFCNKEKTVVWKRGEQKREVKEIRSWDERIVNNAKTLTRWKDYGKRLHERGHALSWEHDDKGEPYFILRSSIASTTGKRKKKVQTHETDNSTG